MNGEILMVGKINEEIKDLKNKKIKLQEEMKEKKIRENQEKKKRKISSNVLKRISTKFDARIDEINEKREEIGFNKLSKPKVTELIARHKLFSIIEEAIVHFNSELEENEK